MRVSCNSIDTLDALAADVPRNSVSVTFHVPAGIRTTPSVQAGNRSCANDLHANDETVLIALTVDTHALAAVRRTLHVVLGDVLGIYTATIDRRTGRTCVQIEVAASRAQSALAVIARSVPDAALGPVRSSHRGVQLVRCG